MGYTLPTTAALVVSVSADGVYTPNSYVSADGVHTPHSSVSVSGSVCGSAQMKEPTTVLQCFRGSPPVGVVITQHSYQRNH